LSGVRTPVRSRFFSSVKRPDRSWGPDRKKKLDIINRLTLKHTKKREREEEEAAAAAAF
jgi:hypothetical protein